MALLKLIPDNTNFNFVGFRFVTFGIALLIAISTLVTISTKGINYGIDFEGGYILDVKMAEVPDVSALRDKLTALNFGEATIQQFGDEREILVKVERNKDETASESEAQAKAIDAIKEVLGTHNEYRKVETVGPKVGSELIANGVKAILLALAAMLLYIAVRFEWQFAVCGIVALMHDIVAIMALFSIFHFEFNENAIIAVLITAGYSINDTIVIFDRIRENIRKYKKMDLATLINKSINETLSRTALTASTTLIALLALYFWGGKVISGFSLPIIIGILIGSFSSICLAAPLLLYLKVKRGETLDIKQPANAQ